MTDTLSYAHSLQPAGSIDPDRPWITDPEEDLKNMSWFKTLFSPLGKTSRLHFTRAWTLMFMGRLLVVVVPTMIGFLMSLAGANGGAVSALAGIGAAIVFPVTIFTSLFAHVKRLSHAGKSMMWAGLVLAPLICATAAFVFVASQSVGEANKIAEQIEFAQENPEAAKAKMEAEREARKAAAESSDAKTRKSASQSQGSRRGGPGGQEFSASQYVVGKAMPLAIITWALTSLAVMLWTLLWVARLPRAGAPPAPPRAKQSYEV